MNGAAQWEKFAPHIGNIPGQKGAVAYGIGFHLDDGKGIEYMCAVEVSGTKKLPEQFTLKQIPERQYAVFVHNYHVSTIRHTLDAIAKWLPHSDFEKPDGMDFFFERYGEKFDPKTGFGDIEIWVPVKV
jgi:AraC family transcriptional regulator